MAQEASLITAPPQAAMPCRLCGAATALRFCAPILDRSTVGYHRCEACGCLQTDPPDWLDESYAHGNLAAIDVGAAERVIANARALGLFRCLLGWGPRPRLLDYGGGDGLLVRLLRDQGFEAYVHDTHTPATYGAGFEGRLEDDYDIITLFEVLEHLPNPRAILPRIFGRPAVTAIVASTRLYEDQGADWWYLAPHSGQHVFFYTMKALRELAAAHGFALSVARSYLLFTRREISPLMSGLIEKLLRRRIGEVLQALLRANPDPHIHADFDDVRRLRQA